MTPRAWWQGIPETARHLMILFGLGSACFGSGIWFSLQFRTPQALRTADTALGGRIDSTNDAARTHALWGDAQRVRLDNRIDQIDARTDSTLRAVRRMTDAVENLTREMCIDRAEREGRSARGCGQASGGGR